MKMSEENVQTYISDFDPHKIFRSCYTIFSNLYKVGSKYPPTYSKWETCAFYLKHKVFCVACAKLNKIRDIRPSWCKNTISYIKEIMVTMVFHGITTPLQIKLHLVKQTFPFIATG